ncbi:MAG: ABC transporter permease [Desulfobulbus sp.]
MLLPLLLILALWQVTAQVVLMVRGVSFPTPWQTAVVLKDLAGGQRLLDYSIYHHLGSSLQRWLAGFTLASVCGLGYGLVSGLFPAVERAIGLIPRLLLLIPGLAWVPVALLLFGIGPSATVFMIAVTAFAPIAVDVRTGIREVDIRWIRAAQMMGAPRHTLFLRVLLPAALPHILSGLRIGLGTGWRVLVAAEMVVGTGSGLGYAIIQARWTLDYPASFACLVLICAIGLACEQLFLGLIEQRFCGSRGRIGDSRAS